MAVPAKLQRPAFAGFIAYGRKLAAARSYIILNALQFFPFDLTSVFIEPDLVVVVASNFHLAVYDCRLIICVERLDVYRNFVIGKIEVVICLRVDVVALPRDAHGVAADDLTTRRIGNSRFNEILPILTGVAWCFKDQRSFAIGVGLERFPFDNLALAAVLI